MIIENEHGKERLIRVDTETGEILKDYDSIYETVDGPFKHDTNPKLIEKYLITSKPPIKARHVDEIHEFMKVMWDLRKPMVTHNKVRHFFDASCGAARLNKDAKPWTRGQYELLENIVQNLTYRNILMGNVEEVAEKLGTHPAHLLRKLKIVKDWVFVETSRSGNVLQGQIKIVIKPWLGFKYPYHRIREARHSCEESWYRGEIC